MAAACAAYLGDMYVKRTKTAEDGQKIVDAMHVEQEHVKTEQPGTSSVQRSEVEIFSFQPCHHLSLCYAPSCSPPGKDICTDASALQITSLLICNIPFVSEGCARQKLMRLGNENSRLKRASLCT